jgi:hypothetical protein
MLAVGTKLGRYEILSQIGVGGIGKVYLAEDTKLNRTDGRYLSFIGTPPDPSNIWLQPAAGGKPLKLTDFKTDYIYRHAWSRDGKTLALARGRHTSDVVLMRDNR